MNLNDPVRWAVVDLLRALDAELDGRLHAEFGRIAGTLGIELLDVTPPPDPAPGSEDETDGEATDETDGEGVRSRWLVECIDTSEPNAQTLAAKLYESWSQWAGREKEPAGTPTALTRELNKRFPGRSSHKAEGTAFAGLRIK
jgi:hypothetical protein